MLVKTPKLQQLLFWGPGLKINYTNKWKLSNGLKTTIILIYFYYWVILRLDLEITGDTVMMLLPIKVCCWLLACGWFLRPLPRSCYLQSAPGAAAYRCCQPEVPQLQAIAQTGSLKTHKIHTETIRKYSDSSWIYLTAVWTLSYRCNCLCLRHTCIF